MSYEDGWAAINLEMPGRVPRTEYSAEGHWELIKATTGIEVGVESPDDVKTRAGIAFMRAWNYDLVWGTLIHREEFGNLITDMGHSEYAAGGVDRRDAVVSPFKTPEEVLAFDPWEQLGVKDRAVLTHRFEQHYRSNCAAHPFAVNMTGTYVTLISGLIDLFGWDLLLLALGTDPRRFGQLATRYAAWMQQYFDALAEADVPLVMVHDDIVWSSGPFMRPAWYREYVFPNYRKYITPLLDSGKKVLFCSDGKYDEFVNDIAATGVHGFVLEPLTDLEYIVGKYGQTHIIVGNADTRVLLMGKREAIRAEVERCLVLGKPCPGYFLAVGNHIPPNTPVENALYYNQVY
ncbi:MAG: hypothetical protein M1546_05130, partial [Chloroflexi bacterium]|nr:hypothetical protein [Chloroflexota bacterium]